MTDIPPPILPSAPPPAPHQVAAFSAAKLQATIVTVLGFIVAGGGAILDALTSSSAVPPHAHWVILAGALIAAAGRLEAALAHASFQGATDN